MKSVEKYPEFQSDSKNIQFLTRKEHLEAHDGNWKKPTNWYYNPYNKEKSVFDENSYVPCKIINLGQSIIEFFENLKVLSSSENKSNTFDSEIDKNVLDRINIVKEVASSFKMDNSCDMRKEILKMYENLEKKNNLLDENEEKISISKSIFRR
ncbi:MAG: hypothetical protein PUB15_04015 [Ruminobacter sp.]|nr:hypothetical protein [Ruminobacter sp.]